MANSIFLDPGQSVNFSVPGQTVGDLFYADSATTIARLADVAAGSVLVSGGVGAAPAYSATPTLTSVLFGGNAIVTSDAANAVAQRNGTTAQVFRVYNTFTSATDYERIGVNWSSNTAQVHVEKGSGGGSGRTLSLGTDGAASILFRTNGSNRWDVRSNGHFFAQDDNTYDIGSSGAARPRTGYFGTSVVSPAYTVGATAGASFNGAITNLTVVNGIVTAAS